MLKMSGFDVLFAAVGNLYLLLALACVCVALWMGKTGSRKLIYASLVLALFIAPIAPEIYRTMEYRSKLAKAQALFDERCKTAGEVIYRRVENVEGVLLLKIRPNYNDRFGSDPMYPGAALIDESGGDSYIASFLRYERTELGTPMRSRQLTDEPTALPGYRYVEAIDPTDGKRYRYTAEFRVHDGFPLTYFNNLNRVPALEESPQYAVTYEDLVDPQDRKHWVAGTVLKVLDTKTGEVVAKQTRYLIDPGLGNTAEGRNPWGWASSYVPGCPRSTGSLGSATRYFVDQVLKPIKEK